MNSLLVIVPVEKLQSEISSRLKSQKDAIGIYVSLNKTKKSLVENLKKDKINPEKLFFIDCISSEEDQETIKIKPSELDKLLFTIKCFIREIKGKKFIIIDSLVTLLLYNNENKVAQFAETLAEYSSNYNINLVAVSQKTSEELLNKIYNFFDRVEK